MKKILILIAIIGCISCQDQQKEDRAEVSDLSWKEIESMASGTTVHLMMWQGDPYINSYMKDYVKPQLDSLYNIDLKLLSGQGNQIVSHVMTELEAGVKESEIDMCWINGETFYQLREVDGLYGPFLDQLPNAKYLDLDNPFIANDFQQPINGYECPWGNVQQTLIYDSAVVQQPPRTMGEFADYVAAHPGTFTIPNDFTGMTLLKAFMVELAGTDTIFYGEFDEAVYEKYSTRLWEWINANKQYFWKNGATFPEAVAPMHQLFANGELHFTASNNDGEVDNKVIQGLFPKTARAYVLNHGTIQNSHYQGIVAKSGNKAGAMVAINFLISPEAQLQKLDPAIWGDGTVLDRERLPEEWQEKFRQVPNRKYAPPRSRIEDKAIREFAPEYMIRLFEDFRTEVIE